MKTLLSEIDDRKSPKTSKSLSILKIYFMIVYSSYSQPLFWDHKCSPLIFNCSLKKPLKVLRILNVRLASTERLKTLNRISESASLKHNWAKDARCYTGPLLKISQCVKP